jgi:uncharacterized protein (DUF433 family)
MSNRSGPYFPSDPTLTDDGLFAAGAGSGERYLAFAAELGRELAPRNPLQRILADRVILSAWTLQSIGEQQRDRICCPGGPTDAGAPLVSGGTESGIEVTAQDVLVTVSCLEKSLDLLRRLQMVEPAQVATPARPALGNDTATEIDIDSGPDSVFDLDSELIDDHLADLSNEWPVVPRGRCVEEPLDADPDDQDSNPSERQPQALPARWADRLVFDVEVSDHSPVVKGTWITVSQVVSLILDGWSWSDILRAHPELAEDDIRVCLAYTVAQEQGDL